MDRKSFTKTRADFDYSIFNHPPAGGVIAIEDRDQGGMSVTNDIENVVAHIGEVEEIDPRNFLIIYRDSQGVWDGWNPQKNDFVYLGQQDTKAAIDKYYKLLYE